MPWGQILYFNGMLNDKIWPLRFTLGAMARAVLWLGGAATVCGAVLFAQPIGGSVVGRVADTTDAVLPGASVTLFPARGGPPIQAIADHEGRYRFDDLPADTYRIDFNLNGFDRGRLSHVEVQPGATATANGSLRVGSVCECVRAGHGVPVVSVTEPPLPIEGRVIDNTGRALPFAMLELVRASGRETAYTDREGHVLVHAPAGAWSITAFDDGFEPVTIDISGTTSGSLVFTLPQIGTQDITNRHRANRPTCYCPAESFVHEQR